LYAIKRPTSENVAVPPITGVYPKVPIGDTVGAIAQTAKAGYVRYIWLSEVCADLQVEYIPSSLADSILPACAHLAPRWR
jgi:aryl-alcohol dehydrogenase-like predicted oxidoreductase